MVPAKFRKRIIFILYLLIFIQFLKILYVGHDLFVNEKYRGDAGLLLFGERMKRFRIIFGVGLSEISFLIHLKLGFKLHGNMKNLLNFEVYFNIFFYI